MEPVRDVLQCCHRQAGPDEKDRSAQTPGAWRDTDMGDPAGD